MASNILPDPYVREEQVPLKLVQDVSVFDVKAKSVALYSDYVKRTSQVGKMTVMRVAWCMPVLVTRTDSGGSSKLCGDSRGRMVTPLGFLIRVTNISGDRLVWHVNSPYQEGDQDGIISARVGDKVLEIVPGQTRVHAHTWGNGAHFFPLRGLLRKDSTTSDTYPCAAIADFFFLRDRFGTSNYSINVEHDMVRVEVSVKYHADTANIESAITEDRKAMMLVDLSSFDSVYHVDPLAVTTAGISAPLFTSAITEKPYLMAKSYPSPINKTRLVGIDDKGNEEDITAFYGVNVVEGSYVIVTGLNVTYKDNDQNTLILNTYVKSGGAFLLVGNDGRPATWTRAIDKFKASSSTPCLFFLRPPIVQRPRGVPLEGGRYAGDLRHYGAVPWPGLFALALEVGSRILSLIKPNLAMGSPPRSKAPKNKGPRRKRAATNRP